MTTTADTIDHATLARLVGEGAVRGADVIGHGGGWGVVVKYGMSERALAARRGAVRTFRKFETLVAYLKGLGISQYNVNATDFDPETIKASRVRPDASERLRSAFEAKAHADWVGEKVAESLADPRPNIPHRQVMDQVQALIDAKRKQHAAKAAS
ncbi:MAG: antitoxin PaaA2 family protein [Rhodoferax sp.]